MAFPDTEAVLKAACTAESTSRLHKSASLSFYQYDSQLTVNARPPYSRDTSVRGFAFLMSYNSELDQYRGLAARLPLIGWRAFVAVAVTEVPVKLAIVKSAMLYRIVPSASTPTSAVPSGQLEYLHPCVTAISAKSRRSRKARSN
jgi:hypothetical protein